jgi:(-)-germacrene D synthase
MREYDMNREAAIQECQKKIDNAWKDINQECLKPTEVPLPILTCVLNLSRFIEVFYKDTDNYTHSDGLMKTYINDLLVNPIEI